METITILSTIANRKYTSSSKQAARYEKDVQDAILKCAKNIARSLEDAQDEAAKALRLLDQKIEDLSAASEVNIDQEISEILENARDYDPKDFLLKLDRAFQHEESEKARIEQNAKLAATLRKGYDRANYLIRLRDGLLSASEFKLDDAVELADVKRAIANLRACYAEQARMKRIKELLASEASEEVIKK